MQIKNSSYDRQYECWLNVGKASLKCQRTMNSMLADLEVTIAQHELLLRIYQSKRITQKQLAAKLLVVKSNVANHVKRLEQRGFIKTIECVKDRRSRLLVLTSKGEKLVVRSIVIQETVVSKMLENVSASDIRATNRVMEKVIEALDKL